MQDPSAASLPATFLSFPIDLSSLGPHLVRIARYIIITDLRFRYAVMRDRLYLFGVDD